VREERCLGEEQILSFIQGELSPAAVADVDGHVDRCSVCAMALYELGELERDLRHYPQADNLLRQSLAIVERTVGPDHRGASFVLAALGHLRLAAGDPRGALAPLRRAEALQTADRLDAARVSDTRFALARALHATRSDAARARELAAQAADGYRSTGERRAMQLAEVEAWLAKPEG
jgi:tetratricopeptide (TPR) repeat protein